MLFQQPAIGSDRDHAAAAQGDKMQCAVRRGPLLLLLVALVALHAPTVKAREAGLQDSIKTVSENELHAVDAASVVLLVACVTCCAAIEAAAAWCGGALLMLASATAALHVRVWA